jgi:hypothetical protein
MPDYDMPLELAPIDQGDIDGVKEGHIKVEDLQWRTKDEGFIRLKFMQDSHLRNAALMLMGMGYQTYRAKDETKILWLTAFRMEWERRMMERKTQGLVKTTH